MKRQIMVPMNWYDTYKTLPLSLVGLLTQGIYALLHDGEDIVTAELEQAIADAQEAFKTATDKASVIRTITDLQNCKAMWTNTIIPFYANKGAEQ